MNRNRFFWVLLSIVCFISGCSKPDKVTAIKSSMDGVFYTIETNFGHGPMDSDYTRVYANLKLSGKVERIVVLGGEYLADTKVFWAGPNEVILCMDGGFTDTFRNKVTLISGATSVTINNHLLENCNAR